MTHHRHRHSAPQRAPSRHPATASALKARPVLWVMALLTALLLSACTMMPSSMREPFGPTDFTVSEFRDFSQLETHCAEPAPTSFWCEDLTQRVDRVPTKGVDVFFSDAGEVVAAFAKFQKGQHLANYATNNADNLVPREAPYPGGAILLDGDYHRPQDAQRSWTQLSEVEHEGVFTFTLPGYEVERRVVISNVEQTLRSTITLTPIVPSEGEPAEPSAQDEEAADEDDAAATAEAAEPSATLVQYAYPGIARQASPTIKIGQAETYSVNPVSAPVDDPRYLSLQSAANNSGNAILMLPREGGAPLQAISLGAGRAAMQAELGPGETRLAVDTYVGKNELVRFYQASYYQLPGLFDPNILGRLSLWILSALEFIHSFVPSWGLSIIVLTLVFRALVWPLITTQTRSMFGMQKLQPEMQKLQKKYKDDREKLSQEMMKLYKEAGVNPAGGCLPILLQMPLFIILWRVFVNFEFNEGFLWIPDLGLSDPFYILPALYVAVMLGQSWYSARNNPNMLRQSMIINLVFVFIIINFPSGVLVYFVVSMGVQVFQYWLLSRGQPPPPAPAVPAKAKG